jgi:hypothetical protein
MTFMASKLKNVAAAAAMLVAANAFAGTFMPEVGIGYGQGKHIDNTQNTFLIDGAFGYRFDTGLGVRALYMVDADPYRGLFENDRSFDDFLGVQATAYLPLTPRLSLMGGIGIGRTSLNIGGQSGGAERLTDGVLSTGLQVHMGRHYSMELHFDYLTKTGTSNLALMAQIPF